MDECLLCGRPLPPDRRWAIMRWLNPRPPTHNPHGPDAVACWRGLNERLGLDPDRPMP